MNNFFKKKSQAATQHEEGRLGKVEEVRQQSRTFKVERVNLIIFIIVAAAAVPFSNWLRTL